ncbi:LuxR C-terminal-related transcriptional regulator [Herbiconiux sp. CPCC 205763]|uniref:LuxR C-terminal-related transcriptional regulator n=1 Tax=Herbiconiux aconitum TaxID=2970913 RepID=A0ABT2GNI5_9MICO|nr:LuxR C-terminal-related transcriptional regulator [Herbiconiux aconitum]MCS5717779.1 LuxR C-terminal-related transcriptional regulator [Herbiconiux aconitum]
MNAIDLTPHREELRRLLLQPVFFEKHKGGDLSEEAQWLLDQYAEIVPLTLDDVISSVSLGTPLSAQTREAIRSSALRSRGLSLPLGVVLRGAKPALRALLALLRTRMPALTASEVALLLGRAALIGHDITAWWVEDWLPGGGLLQAEAPPVESVAVAEGDHVPDDPAIQMVALAAAGESTDQIAASTGYSRQAVKWHLSRLMRSWSVGNRSALVAAAFLRGVLIPLRRPDRNED